MPGYRPPPFDLAAGLRPPPAPGADYLQRLMTPHGLPGPDALQRQLLYERERGLLGGLGAASLAASQQLQHLQQEEFLRSILKKIIVRHTIAKVYKSFWVSLKINFLVKHINKKYCIFQTSS